MKKQLSAIFIISVMVLSACGTVNDDYNGANGNGMNPTIEANEKAGTPGQTQQETIDDFGYTRIQSPIGEGRRQVQNAPQINKKQLSDIISRLVMQMEDVRDSATLVTSEEVLIVYDAEMENRNKMADMVKRTAISVVPRWYHVYVSDDTTLFEYIERYKNLDANSENVEGSLDALIKEMKKSPQGKRISEGENENGELEGEMNENLNKDEAK
ncbi:YhcN/YlaJ family sporulation lipoprotein [Alkalihalobacillus sp. AL-G]|uniref:YhcN/YlaJ family sporulation lipoprotein n=1 Tax=Alkalihalobacillus sp. AL-G TaxID=2926399 RepID=UPI00272C94FC|nr:YhcN/YlaJ family sporulation lipoprotein [Alkalihalobacillus sp. AL-G]WLD92695.1 YhcN/YlaJ family sporulation lipoprotein [Alkalihalobacillus sp. AL-G]